MGATGQTIVIHGNRELGPSRLHQGFLHGVSYERGKDYSRTIALVAALKPTSWRISTYGHLYEFVVREAKLPQTFGTKIVFSIQDVFNSRYGQDVKVKSICPPKRKNCFTSYESFKQSWMGVVNSALKAHAGKKLTIDYIDVFAEPDYGHGKLDVTPEQLGDIFKSTHDAVRQYRPDAKIVAPSFVQYRGRHLRDFLAFVARNDLRLDALSWHEFNTPEDVLSHVDDIRGFIKTQPKLCNPRCPEIHINEYAPEEQHFTPGYGVGWLYYLEKAGVDQANRACWDFQKGASTCWAGFNGLLAQDNVTPLPLYWVYKAYADMNPSRLSSETTLPRTVALASNDESKREMRILAGKYGQKGASGRVAIEVRDFRHNLAAVTAEITRIPDARSWAQTLAAPPTPAREVIRVQGNSFSIVIPDFRDGEAYSIVVRPGGSSAR